jgi:hypothetical protein
MSAAPSLASSLFLLDDAKKACARNDFLGAYVCADSASIAADVARDEGASIAEVRTIQVRIASFIVDTWAPRALKLAERSPPELRVEQLRAIGVPLVQCLGYLAEQAKAGRLQYRGGVSVSVEEVERTALELTRPIVEALGKGDELRQLLHAVSTQ